MPIDRNRLQRLRVIHALIARNARPNWRLLAEECIAKLDLPTHADSLRRTIFDDLNELRAQGAPLVSQKGTYTYSVPFSLNHIINPDELTLLGEVQALFRQYATLPQFKGFEEIQLKIAERAAKKQPPFVVFEQNLQYTGLRHLWPIYEAIRNQNALNIQYRDFQRVPTQHSLSPYQLREYNNRWYVFGWQNSECQLYNLALDRIVQIEPSLFAYRPAQENINDFLRDVVGVTRYRDTPLQTVRLRVQNPRAYYLTTKPLHHSQRCVEETEEATLFEFWVVPNPELESEILALGADAEVLAPASLRARLKATVAQMQKMYAQAT